MNCFYEAPKQVPVIYEADICVVGGSATGVFAAVRAARLGAKVVIVERMNSFGGNATNGLMTVWHSFHSRDGKKQVISGLSEEMLGRLHPLDVESGHKFNPAAMKYELDRILIENNVKIFLHTYYAGLAVDGDEICAVFVENKDGRGAIKAKFFIDATGDGDLCRDLKIERYEHSRIQPPSYVFLMQGYEETPYVTPTGETKWNTDARQLLRDHKDEYGVEEDHGWAVQHPCFDNISLRVDSHVFYVQCGKADDLTKAELEGRRKMHSIVSVLRKYGDQSQRYSVVADSACIGIRETYHYKTQHQANYLDLLTGKKYDDCIMCGTYSGDVQSETEGTKFMELDGTYTIIDVHEQVHRGNWREELGLPTDVEMPTYYQLPFKTIVPEKIKNVIAAGRMINADPIAFGGLRVMVNLNQIGEAAGVAAYLALHKNKAIQDICGVDVAKTLSAGGSANLG